MVKGKQQQFQFRQTCMVTPNAQAYNGNMISAMRVSPHAYVIPEEGATISSIRLASCVTRRTRTWPTVHQLLHRPEVASAFINDSVQYTISTRRAASSRTLPACGIAIRFTFLCEFATLSCHRL
jgi:hypothetical protein